MTAQPTTPKDNGKRLEEVLAVVRSIDRNVDEILDRLSDHFDDAHYREEWRRHGYDLDNVDPYGPQ